MSGHPTNSRAGRIGRWLGRTCRTLMQQEQLLRLWLVGLGVSAAGAKVFGWCLRLCALSVLLSIAVALVVMIWSLRLIGRSISRSDLSYRTPDVEWRGGYSGFGLYSRDELRIDPHVFDDD